jgi:hypothetical protein
MPSYNTPPKVLPPPLLHIGPNGTLRDQEIPRDTKRYQEIPRDTKRYQETDIHETKKTTFMGNRMLRYQEIPRDTKRYQETDIHL